LTAERTCWYKRFRKGAYVNAVVWLAWTVAILLPFPPFSYLQPIMVGGGAGTWFLVGYLLFPTVSVVGFTSISSLIFTIEIHELRKLCDKTMTAGFILLFAGSLAGCLLLGLAGATAGYAVIIQPSTVNAAENILSAYVNPTTAASLAAVVGAVFIIYAMATAKAMSVERKKEAAGTKP